MKKLFLLLLLIFPSISNAFITEFSKNHNNSAKTQILATNNEENNKITIGVYFKIKKGWKIYAPSESFPDQEPKFNFTNSTNIDINNFDIKWKDGIKKTEKWDEEIFKYKIYKNEILVPITLSKININKDSNINIKINYGICKDICIPASHNFSFNLKAHEIDIDAIDRINNYDSKRTKPKFNIMNILLIAFIGGLILNIMPCVLPVLSIKLIGIMSYRNLRKERVRKIYFATILGIISTFIAFALITIGLKLFGSSIGWGLQFQNPYFLIFISLTLVIFMANILGLFEISFSSNLTSKLDRRIKIKETENKIFISNYLSGILAVLLATPCSAPFLGTAISFALSTNIFYILIVFLIMSIGFAFPYFLLIINPKFIKLLPKSGKWMNQTKILMAGFLFATLVWILYILSNNLGTLSVIITSIFLIIIMWFLKHSGKRSSNKKKMIVILLISAFAMAIPVKIQHSAEEIIVRYNKLWIKFDENKIQKLIDNGNVVIVDITADWCLTCKVNKFFVLDSKEIVAKIKSDHIFAMRADLTISNPKILEYMAKYNRYAIPFNIIYGPNAKEGILISELLSKKSILEAIEKAE